MQILFAFLLSLAFTSRFEDLGPSQRVTYVITLLLAVLAAAPFTATAALHRSLFQRGAKPRIVRVSSKLATAGLVVLVFAFSGPVLLVVDVTTGRAGGAAASAGTFLACVGPWGLLPRLVRRAGPREEDSGTSASESPGTPSRDGTRVPAPLRHTVGRPSEPYGAAPRREASARHR